MLKSICPWPTLLSLLLTAGLFYCPLAQANSFGANITIYDQSSSTGGDGWYDRGSSPGEDQEVESGCVTGQAWDLEAFFLNGNRLTMVGGWDFVNGKQDPYHSGDQYHYESGDIFLDTNNSVKYGSGAAGGNTLNSFYGYEYVLQMNWAAKTYNVLKLNDSSLLTVFFSANNESNPWRYEEGGTPVSGWQDRSFTSASGLKDDILAGYTGGDHSAITVDLGFLGLAEQNILAHFTMECGNDNLIGQGTATPLPGAVLLLGAGLVRLTAYGRRKLK